MIRRRSDSRSAQPSFRCAAALLAVAAVVGCPRGQAPSAWADLDLPAGVNPAALSAKGSLVLYRDGTFMRVFSAATGRWHAHTPSFGTSVVLERDFVLVPESDRWTAFSAFRGAFAVQFVAYTGPLLVAHDESVACVNDVTQVHAFSAFTGRWHTHALPSGWSINVGPRIVVIVDLTGVWSPGAAVFDAYTGQWYDLGAQSRRPQSLQLSGSSALLDYALFFVGFSALHPGWAASTGGGFASGSVTSHRDDMVLVRDTNFDGLTGTMIPAPGPFQSGRVFATQGLIATADGPSTQHACSIARGAWVALPPGSVNGIPSSGERDAVSLHYNAAGQTIAFSAVSGQYAVVNNNWAGSRQEQGGVVAAVADAVTNAPSVYSALTSQWHPVPLDAQPGLPVVARTAALLPTSTGVSAFSARTGAFVPLAGSGLALYGGRTGSVVAATDPGTLYVFDARADRWLSQPLAVATGQPPAFGASTLVATDATQAVGFSARSGRLETLALPEGPLAAAGAGDVAWVRTATHVFAFTGLPDQVTWAGFPENNIACGIGTTFRDQVRLPAGSFAIAGAGPRLATPAPLPPYGELWLDVGLSLTFLVVPDPGEERGVQALPVPNDPALRNSEWYLQAVVVPAVGQPYLSDPAVVRVL